MLEPQGQGSIGPTRPRSSLTPFAQARLGGPTYSPSRARQTHYDKKKHYRVFMLIVLVSCSAGGFLWFNHQLKNPDIISPIRQQEVAAQTLAELPSPTPKPIEIPTNLPLADQVASVINDTGGTFGIAVKNLTTGETYYERTQDSFTMASTYKIALVLTSFMMEENGELSSDTKLGAYSLDQGRELIITRSEEELAQLLAAKIGWPRVQKTAESLGMKDTHFVDDFTTTPQDILTILEKIYKGQGMSKSVRDKMYDLLVRQEINDRIPKYLPKDITIGHKTGELDDVRHDVGFVSTDKTTYVIVLMSKEDSAPEDAKEVLAKLSLIFYKHFTE